MGENLGKAVGARVQVARKRRGLTQEQLASQVGRTPESISNIERGRYVPSIETLADLSAALQIPIADFFDGATREQPVSDQRRRLEARWQDIGRALSDRDLAVALQQAEVLLKHGAHN